VEELPGRGGGESLLCTRAVSYYASSYHEVNRE
jgi:hypothetical protein